MKIRVEISCLAKEQPSGVANYTKQLTEALNKEKDVKIFGSYFNFLNRQPNNNIPKNIKIEKNTFFPLRIYSKMNSHNFNIPFDLFKPSVDLTIFPNFATWKTCNSKLKATVIHDLTFLYFPDLIEEKNLAHLNRVVPYSIKNADFIIAVSNSVKNEIVKEYKYDPDRIIVTPIPPDEKYLKINNNEIHDKYKIPTKKFIFFIGNLEPRKDLPTLVEAYCKLPKPIKNEYSLIIAGGNGWKTEKSKQTISKAQLKGEKVKHVGFIDSKDSGAFYQKASLFVMTSLYEGFGMPILEAMACNCPVLASDIPVLRETGSYAVHYAKTSDPEDFSKKIEYILNDKNIQNKMIKDGKKRLTEISWDKNVKNIIKISNHLIK